MTLDKIAQAMDATCHNVPPATSISRVTTDSRVCQTGDLFFAIPGERFDGHDFLQQAVVDGVRACVCNRTWLQQADSVLTSLPILAVTDTIEALGKLAGYYRTSVMLPSTTVVAVTGSNGKTTTKHMLDHVLSGSLPGQAGS